MYEPIRTKSVHSTMAGTSDFPHRSREEELDIQLAGHLAALLAVTDELRALSPSTDLDTAAERLVAQVARLRGGRTPLRAAPAAADLRRPEGRAARPRRRLLHGRHGDGRAGRGVLG
ncbi:SCO4983 family protein, partial [Streptomyces sp. NPDC004457]